MSNAGQRVMKTLSGLLVSLAVLVFLGNTTVLAASDVKKPTAPRSLAKATVTSTSVKLTWTKSTDNIGVSSYAVYMNGKYYTATSNTYITIYSLKPSTAYTFTVKARDKAGNYSAASSKLTATTASVAPQKKVFGYYTAWSAYSGYTPDKIPAANLTHINYAFAYIDKDMRIAMGDKNADPKNFAALRALKKKYPSLKVLISVGGWEWSGRFSDMASTYANRTAFANSVVAFLKANGLDGVDLDWEYPVGGGQPDNANRPEDRTNFTLLLQNIRAKLNAQSKIDGKQYLLTVAAGTDQTYVSHVQLAEIGKYVDFASLMTYDMHGPWTKYTDLNAPLYPTTGTSPQVVWSCDQAVRLWQAAGFPKNKLVMGMPLYGYSYTGVTGGGDGLYQSYASCKSISYDNVVNNCLNSGAYTQYSAAKGMVPWLFDGSTFVSYDDAQSLANKAKYVKSKGLAGAMVWELSQNANGSLVKAIKGGMK